MLPLAEPLAAPMPAADAPAAPVVPFAHREPYGEHFARLAQEDDAQTSAHAGARTAAVWRRLLSYIDADIDGPDRVALWRALWQVARRLPDGVRLRIAAQLDGRHALRLAPLAACPAWDDPALVAHLAQHGCVSRAAAASFVPALLAHHGLTPLADPVAHDPALVMATVAARLAQCDESTEGAGDAPGLCGPEIEQLHAAVLVACAAEPAGLPQGLALLFDLALHAGDEGTAIDTLAELIRHGHADALPPARVGQWLDGSATETDPAYRQPLQLAEPLQSAWLRPTDWLDTGALARLAATLQRPAPRLRLQALAERLPLPALAPHADADTDADTDTDAAPAASPASPASPLWERALRALQILDAAYALADEGLDPSPALAALAGPGSPTASGALGALAAPARAALHRAGARHCAARGDDEGELLALLQARRLQTSPGLRAAIARALPPPAPPLDAGWEAERPYWAQLARQGAPAQQRIAAHQLATLWTAGQLEPSPQRRCPQQLDDAHVLWSWLAEDERYEALAKAQLRDVPQTTLRPALRQEEGVEYLWFERPGARAVSVVFSCIASHHSYAEVATLRRHWPGRHLMFVSCPDKNWYCDERYERVHALLQQQVARRFAPEHVCCWYGSMGGHAALKFALAFGWHAIVFNPQTDLDLWAAFRPHERALLWGSERHRVLGGEEDGGGSAAPWQRVPLYYACGATTADREALSWLIGRVRRCAHLSAVIEKFPDPHHAGLMHRIAAGPVPAALVRIEARLGELAGAAPLAGMQALDDGQAAAFWDRLDAARALKVEIQVRDGRLWWQPSAACGTVG